MTEQEQPAGQQPPMKVWWTPRRLNILILVIGLLVGTVIGGWIKPLDWFSNQVQQPENATEQSTEAKAATPRGNTEISPSFGEVDEYRCPEPNSSKWLTKGMPSLKLEQPTQEDFLIVSERPMVHLIGSASTSGLIRLCGGPGRIVMTNVHLNMRVYFGDFGSVLIVDPTMPPGTEYFDSEKVRAVDGETVIEVEYCGTRGQKDLLPCSEFDTQLR